MSDVTQAPATPPPTVTEGSAAPAPAPTVTEAPKTAQDFLARIKSKAQGSVAPSPAPARAVDTAAPAATDAPKVDAQGNLHGKDGTFVPKPAADAPGVQDAQTPAAVEAAVAERVRIALEEGHPLRDRGLAELPFDVPKEHEELARWLANQPVKKREMAQAQELARQAEARAMEREAEAAFWRENAGQVYTPEFYAKYMDIKATYGEADAELYKQAVQAKAQEQLTGKIGEQRAVRQVADTARAFRDAAMQDALQRFPGWVMTDPTGALVPTPEMETAFRSYGALISATGATEPKAEDWYSVAIPLYERSAFGQQRRAAEAQRIQTDAAQRAQNDAAERERQALEQAAAQRQRNPLGSVPNVQTGLSVPGADNRPKSAKEFIERTRASARGLA